jgi:hypothetical protein
LGNCQLTHEHKEHKEEVHSSTTKLCTSSL